MSPVTYSSRTARGARKQKTQSIKKEIPYQGLRKLYFTDDSTKKPARPENTGEYQAASSSGSEAEDAPSEDTHKQRRVPDATKRRSGAEYELEVQLRRPLPAAKHQRDHASCIPQSSSTNAASRTKDTRRKARYLGPVVTFFTPGRLFLFTVFSTWLAMLVVPIFVPEGPGRWGASKDLVNRPLSVQQSWSGWADQISVHASLELPSGCEETTTASETMHSVASAVTRHMQQRESSVLTAQHLWREFDHAIRTENLTTTRHLFPCFSNLTAPLMDSGLRLEQDVSRSLRVMSGLKTTAKAQESASVARKGNALRARDNAAWVAADEDRVMYKSVYEYARQACVHLDVGLTSIGRQKEVDSKFFNFLANHELQVTNSGGSPFDWGEFKEAAFQVLGDLMEHHQVQSSLFTE